MNYADLRKDQAVARERGIYRGIGLATFIEMTNPAPHLTVSVARLSRHRMALR